MWEVAYSVAGVSQRLDLARIFSSKWWVFMLAQDSFSEDLSFPVWPLGAHSVLQLY